MSKIQPCPFCGEKAFLIRKCLHDRTCFDIGCSNEGCYLEDGAEWWLDTEEEVITKWNKRKK